jgi:hypothetical protein
LELLGRIEAFQGVMTEANKKSAAFRLASQVVKQSVSSADPRLSSGAARPKVVIPEIANSITHVSQFANIKFDNNGGVPPI